MADKKKGTKKTISNFQLEAAIKLAESPQVKAMASIAQSSHVQAMARVAASSGMRAMVELAASPQMNAFKESSLRLGATIKLAESSHVQAMARVAASPEMRAMVEFAASPQMNAFKENYLRYQMDAVSVIGNQRIADLFLDLPKHPINDVLPKLENLNKIASELLATKSKSSTSDSQVTERDLSDFFTFLDSNINEGDQNNLFTLISFLEKKAVPWMGEGLTDAVKDIRKEVILRIVSVIVGVVLTLFIGSYPSSQKQERKLLIQEAISEYRNTQDEKILQNYRILSVKTALVRKKFNQKSKIIDTIKFGTVVKVIKVINSTWLEIEYFDNKKGFIKSNLLKKIIKKSI